MKHVHIGKHYRPERYERRASDGQYESFNNYPTAHEELIQNVLLGNRPTRSGRVVSAVVFLCIAAAVFLTISG